MRTRRCPVCGKPLTEAEFEKALQIHQTRQRLLREREQALVKRERVLPKKIAQARQDGERRGESKERGRSQRLMAGQAAKIRRLEEHVRLLEKGTTPQTEGLEFEDKLAKRLKQEFSGDDVQQTRKGGDILHTVRVEKKLAGIIIYECKREPRIKTKHVRQAYLAKQSRHAHFAVLVTTGTRKGFGGLTEMQGVLVVAPLGAIPLGALLRDHLVAMHRAHISKSKRLVIAEQLVKFIRGPEFKNPIEDVIGTASELQDMVLEEAKDHGKVWKKRWDYYQRIAWDSSQIQNNVRSVLDGKEPKQVAYTKPTPLLLPAATGGK